MNKILKFSIALITIIIIILLALSFRGIKHEDEDILEQKLLVSQIENLNKQLSETEEDLKRVITRYAGEDPSVFEKEISMLELSREAQEYLNEMLRKEKGIAYEDILEQVMDKDDQLSRLRQERDRLLSMLPEPDIVEEGDNHYDLAMRYLIERHDLSAAEAQRLVERVALFEHLLPGFIVYHFYDGNDYGTSVLQGTASQSPNFIRERFINQIIKEKTEAIEIQQRLVIELHELDIRKNMLLSQISTLEKERREMLETLDQISLISKEKEIMLSSLYYYAGTVSNLREAGIINVSIFGKPSLRDIDQISEDFRTIDLTMADRIIIEARELGIDKIQRIHILPDLYEQGRDFNLNLAPDGSVFEINILNKNRMKLEKIIIAVQ